MDLTLALILIGLLAGLSLFLALQLVSLNSKNRSVTNDLIAAKARNENALWLLYLLQVTLQVCITVLHDNQQQLNHLHKVYRDFVDQVKNKRDRRLLRKGTFMVLNLIPGVSVLSDLGDIISDIGDIGDISDLSDVAEDTDGSKLEDPEVNSEDPTILNVSPGNARNLLGILGEQNAFKDLEVLDSGTLTAFINEVIKRVEELTRPIEAPQRKKIITRVAAKFKALGLGEFSIDIRREDSEETVRAPQAENSSDSRKKGENDEQKDTGTQKS